MDQSLIHVRMARRNILERISGVHAGDRDRCRGALPTVNGIFTLIGTAVRTLTFCAAASKPAGRDAELVVIGRHVVKAKRTVGIARHGACIASDGIRDRHVGIWHGGVIRIRTTPATVPALKRLRAKAAELRIEISVNRPTSRNL